jgi:transposase InsO family protein
MSYTTNPFAPKARMQARNDVVWGRLTVSEAAVKYGVHRSTVWRWIRKVEERKLYGNTFLWTLPSAPHSHPNQLKSEIVARIIELRKNLRDRCAPVIHEHLRLEGVKVSLSSVERTLRRQGLTRKRRKQPKYYSPLPRPRVLAPGDLVQMDTIHLVKANNVRFYIYTVIDLYSRLAHAEYYPRLLQKYSFRVISRAQERLGFKFNMVQTDNGLEFRDGFQADLGRSQINLRYSRIRKPNDNAHIERFNRTIQDECFQGRLPKEETIRKDLKEYLDYYNNRRLHLSLDLQTPTQFVAKVLK